jgi:NAD(P)-dependent dehydrogenase (short-subunit alcohol dehydrogenase family)
VKPFNIRVALVQPGIIDTAMAREIEDANADPAYRQVGRFAHMFQASLDKPTPPAIVAETIREIIENDSQILRGRSCLALQARDLVAAQIRPKRQLLLPYAGRNIAAFWNHS